MSTTTQRSLVYQVILAEGEKAPSHSHTVELVEETGVPHPITGSNNVQAKDEGIVASVQ